MNVLCLVELDEAGVTDASLRALTFARSLATGGRSGSANGGARRGPARSSPPWRSGLRTGSRPACSATTG